MFLHCQRVSETARLPSSGSEFSAGLDVYSPVDCLIPAHSQTVIPIGFKIAWTGPEAHLYYMQVCSRSGLCVKSSVMALAGVIDFDYRGEVGVVLYNFGDKDVSICVGDRIAQFILKRIQLPIVGETDVLPGIESSRGEGGFGSTGI